MKLVAGAWIWSQGSTNCSILQSQMGKYQVSWGNMENIDNVENCLTIDYSERSTIPSSVILDLWKCIELVIFLRLLRLPTVIILNAMVAVWVFWQCVLSNCPPLQFRQWRDQEKDENHRGTPVNNCDWSKDRSKMALITSAQNLVGMLFSFDCPAFVLTSADGLAGFRLRILSGGS